MLKVAGQMWLWTKYDDLFGMGYVIAFMRISLFITCYNDTLFPDAGKAVVRMIERWGHEVELRSEQTCGQMHWNTDYIREALPIVRHFVEVYRDAETVGIPSPSCAAIVPEHYLSAAVESHDGQYVADVESLLPRVYEFSELLVKKLGVDDVGATFPHEVTYHASCHSLRSLELRDIPIRLLHRVREIDLLELPRLDECCGFSGIFAIKNADVSSAMLADKIGEVLRTGAEVCTAVDNSCLMHLYDSFQHQCPPTAPRILRRSSPVRRTPGQSDEYEHFPRTAPP